MLRARFPLFALLLTFSGCLTAEVKEYRIRLTGGQSGEATIRFINVMSESDDSSGVPAADFRVLVESYFLGSSFEKDNPSFHNVRKRLYEEQGVLVGELSFSFDSLSAMRIFRYSDQGPLMLFVGDALSSERLLETNGRLGPEWMPVVFWPGSAEELVYRTRIQSNASIRSSLLRPFREWNAGGSRKH